MRRLLLLLLAAATLAAALLGWWAWRAWQSLAAPYSRHRDPVTLDVAAGTTAAAILRRLEAEGVLQSAELSRLYLIHVLGDPHLKAGEYLFTGPLSARQVLDRLVRGDVVLHRLTIIEGLTLEETAAQLAAQGFGDRDRFVAEMRDPARILDLDPLAGDLEGYLLPDSYDFPRRSSEAAIVDRLTGEFRRRYRERVAPQEPSGWTVRELVTLASIVEKEAALDEERPRIAAVYHNRLRRGIALYADPTVIYALRRLGRWDGNLRRADLRLDSPYNTYVHPGLPPGPICSPGLASLLAAAAPAATDDLYFVSRNDGSHVFAETLAEHNRNVERWQRRYWRERWAAERSKPPSP